VRTTMVHPGDRPVDGPRDRPTEGCAGRGATLPRLRDPAEPIQDLDRAAAGIEDACVEGSFRPDPAAMDVVAARGGRSRGGADQDETHCDSCDTHGRTISGPAVGRNRRKVTAGQAFAVASRSDHVPDDRLGPLRKPMVRCVPSQNGLFAEPPHLHSATRVSSRIRCPLASSIRIFPRTNSGPLGRS
jgi:hypothetical protein